MKSMLSSFILLASLSMLLLGCPYESDFPLDDHPSVLIDESLLGTWRTSGYPSDSTEIIFKRKSGKEYDITTTLSGGLGGYTNDSFTGYLSRLKGKSLLNVKKREDNTYYIVEVVLKDGKLSLSPLSEEITTRQFSSPAEWRKFIAEQYTSDTIKYDEESQMTDLEKKLIKLFIIVR